MESEIDLSVEPHTTDEHDGISITRKRRRLTHKSHVSVRFSDDFEEDDVMQVQADCSVLRFLMRRELLLERLALLVSKAIFFPSPWKRVVNLVRPSLEDTDTLSSSSRREMTPPVRRVRSRRYEDRIVSKSFWGCKQWPECNGTRRPCERGKDEISPA